MSTELPPLVQRDELFSLLDEIIDQNKIQQSEFAILLVKIDRFRYLNLTHGFDVGDQLISEIHHRLTRIARAQDQVIRYSASEFAMIIRNLHGEGHADLAAIRILAEFEDTFDIAENRLRIAANIGGAIFPVHGRDPASLCSSLEKALVDSRNSQEKYSIYAMELNHDDALQWDIRSELKQALDRDQFELFFQPQVELETGRISGAEALLRWKHPVRGYISPGSFIPVAEQDGLIHDITVWIIHTALWLIREWPSGKDPLKVSVNLSPKSFEHEDLIESVNDTSAIFDTRPYQLTLEVTESAIMKDMNSAIRILDSLKSAGVNISIDDFGTGYSSFAYFKRIPASELKIDRSFVTNILQDPVDLHIVKSIINMAHGFGLAVVAEGIEDRETYQKLDSLDCDYAQGNYVSEPLNQDEFIDWLNRYNEAIGQLDTDPSS